MSTVFVRRAVACSAAFGLLAACSSSKSISSGTDATSTAPATTVPTTVAPTTSTVDVPTTLPIPPTCADTTEPSSDAISLTVIDGDWNGDGSIDLGYSWAEPSGGGVSWFVRAEVSGGASSTIAIPDVGAAYAQALDGVDVDFALGADPGVNRDEMLAVVGGGASGLNLGIFGFELDGCMFQFDNGAGGLFSVSVAATTGEMSGLLCDGAAGSQFLVALQASTADGITWDTADFRIERVGDHSLMLSDAALGSLLATDGGLGAYSHAQCGGTIWI